MGKDGVAGIGFLRGLSVATEGYEFGMVLVVLGAAGGRDQVVVAVAIEQRQAFRPENPVRLFPAPTILRVFGSNSCSQIRSRPPLGLPLRMASIEWEDDKPCDAKARQVDAVRSGRATCD